MKQYKLLFADLDGTLIEPITLFSTVTLAFVTL